MNAHSQAKDQFSSENWDDDFEFNSQERSRQAVSTTAASRPSVSSSHFSEDWDMDNHDISVDKPNDPPLKIAGTSVLADKLNFHAFTTPNWGDASAPSTPTKRGIPPSSSQTENWDDDFEDGTDSPMRGNNLPSHPLATTTPRSSGSRVTPTSSPNRIRKLPPHYPHMKLPSTGGESWDEEFEQERRRRAPKHSSPNKRPRPDSYVADNSSDDDGEFGMDKEDDRTVTSRNSKLRHSLVPPLVPSLPTSNGDHGSPAPSVFSIPLSTGRNSITYSSTTHLALRPTVSNSSSALGSLHYPSNPPAHRPRRLRKKSRPQHLEDNIFELEDRSEANIQQPLLSSTPPQPGSATTDTYDPRASTPSLSVHSTDVHAPSTSPPNKAPLLLRIGSVKKWGVRRKRASTAPSEVVLNESGAGPSSSHISHPSLPVTAAEHERTPRPQNSHVSPTHEPPSQTQSPRSSGWFFRSGGGPGSGTPPTVMDLDDNIQKNNGKAAVKRKGFLGSQLSLHNPVSTDNSTPESSPSKLSKHRSIGAFDLLRRRGGGGLGNEGSGPAFPSTMAAPTRPPRNGARSTSYAYGSGSDLHLNQGGGEAAPVAQAQRSASRASASGVSSASFSTDDLGGERMKDKEGRRGFMGNIRRVSFGGQKGKMKQQQPQQHRRSKSTLPLEETRTQAKDDAPVKTAPDPPPPPQEANSTTANGERLLPPIELQPPSPPTTLGASSGLLASQSMPVSGSGIDMLLSPDSGSGSLGQPTVASAAYLNGTRTPNTSPSQSASLGRSTSPSVIAVSAANNVPRRNSLGDLKIPARISQAQSGLRRDLVMVREFAANVEKLKDLQTTYITLICEVQKIFDTPPPPQTRPTAPLFHLPHYGNRQRSHTIPINSEPNRRQIANQFDTITSKYKLSWECAELLIELGGGTPTSPPVSSMSVPAMLSKGETPDGVRKGRERAITLAGEQSPIFPGAGVASSVPNSSSPLSDLRPNSPPNMAWRASTGRHDLSQRQLSLLRDMLHGEEPAVREESDQHHTPEEPVNRGWRWGNAMSSTVTLPSEDSSGVAGISRTGKKRMGLAGFRDLLKSMKRSAIAAGQQPVFVPPQPPAATTPLVNSSVSLSTDSSVDSHGPHWYDHPRLPVQRKRAAKTSTGPEAVMQMARDQRPNSPYNTGASGKTPASPRRPSLASIFRMGKSNSSKSTASSTSSAIVATSLQPVSSRSSGEHFTADEEDWDRMDSDSDLEAAAKALGMGNDGTATVRGTKAGRQRAQSPFVNSALEATPKKAKKARPEQCFSAPPVLPIINGSQSSINVDVHFSSSAILPRATRLSNVDENVDSTTTRQQSKASSNGSPTRPPRSTARLSTTGGSLRGATPTLPTSSSEPPPPSQRLFSDPKLAMTPENIKPLLENAKDVYVKLNDCIEEIRMLLAA